MEKVEFKNWLIFVDYSTGDELERVDIGPYMIPPPKVDEVHKLKDGREIKVIRFYNESNFSKAEISTKVYVKLC